MNCKHKFKIHDTFFTSASTTGTFMEHRATVVCEKCGLVKVSVIEYPNKSAVDNTIVNIKK